MHDPGRIKILTGRGKGKSSAAYGLAARLASRGRKVAIVCFDKSRHQSKDFAFLELFGGHIEPFIFDVSIRGERGELLYDFCTDDLQAAELGFNKAKELANSGLYEVLILDEINVLASLGMLNPELLLSFIKTKPYDLELILTGQNCPKLICNYNSCSVVEMMGASIE